MKILRAIFWCLATMLYIEGSLEAVNVTHHSRRAHRHEKSRLRRQHGAEPSVYILESEDGTGPEDERGDWGPWSPPSPCSRTCGGGVSFQTRECSAYSACTGGKKRYFSCNTQECSGGGDFRAEQCAAYNTIPYDGYYYQWVPYTKADNKCALNCMPRGERYYYRHQDKVHDGTKCSEDSLDICVNGKCMPVGCDLLLGSTAREDQCRVCGGDGSTCTTKSGLLEDNAQLPGYIDLLLIPIGATNIKIKERRASNNYLAIRNTTGHFYLNGNWQIDFSRSLKFAGTIFYYNRKPYPFSGPESIHALGPTTEALYVSLLYQETNPGFEYVYSVPKGSVKETPREAYKWRYGEFSSCSVTCGGGYQSRKVWCSHGSEEVSFELCDPASEPASTQICASQACAAAWHTTEWSPCDAPCGELGTQTREVSCQQVVGTGQPVLVTESRCPGEKPPNTQPCKETGPCPTWHVGPWKPCDRLCGEGKQTRELHCYRKIEGRIELLSPSSCAEKKPESEKSCNLRPCEGLDWITSDWSGCSDKCGQAVETRTATCANEKGQIFNESMCHDYRKPELVRNCTYKPCASQWFASQWSECSVKCGSGVQTRDVFCASFEGVSLSKVDDSKCDEKQKYESTKDCKAEGECKGEWFASPFSECSKKCGGGVMERKVVCLKQNKTVDIKECDESKFLLTSEECNKEPCGEDEILPVEPTQIITEDESEECDDDEYDDYDETTGMDDLITGNDTLSTVGVLKITDEIEEGSGDLADDFILSSKSVVSETASETVSFPTESYETSTTMSSKIPEVLKDEPVTGSAVVTETSTISGSSSDSSSSTDLSSTTSIDSSTSSWSTDSSSELSSVSSSGSTDMTESSSTVSGSTDAWTSTDSSTSYTEFTTTDVSESSERGSTDGASSESSLSSLMTESSAASSSESSTDVSESSSGSSTDTSESTVNATEESSESTTESFSSSTDIASSSTIGGDSTTWSTVSEFTSIGTSDLTELLFGVTTPGPESEVTKARRKCKKRTGKKKCVASKFGCCPDNKTEAKGPFAKGCPMPKTCEESKFGCCSDKVSPAKGPKNKGCPPSLCEQTLFGCCPDGSTPSMGNDYEGCPQATTLPPDCTTTKYGCCPDGILSATGANNAGCFESCNETTHGCCPDGESAATGSNFQGCDIVSENCSNTTYGCCPDSITIAQGPDEEGCQNCTDSKYGCCSDGIIAARGANMFGCPPTCTISTFGCCEDNVTIAHGPNFEGCCLNSPHGCCKDDITPAQGPSYYGCDCDYLTFGCCPDGRTPARGPNKEDCGCEYTEHGCCPDRITVASGPNYDGCSCHTYQFGCCPDGITVVKGPNLQGCGCQKSEYGCCPDEVTTRPGPDQNCTCDASKYGCCPDGIGEATGENFEGCENVPVTGEVCSLPRDNGHCRNFKIFYYFDTTYGGCARLWYGGCGGNGNRFGSLEECKAACVHPKGKDACLLPKSAGSCKHDISKWYFDKQYKRCRQFSYTGCLGNSNKFASSEECEQVCGTQDHLDQCEQTLEPGPCQGSYERWYYNKDSEACLPFTYGGCKGTKNNFPSEAACKAKCSRPDKVKEVCSVPKAVGNCKEKLAKWFFDSTERRCMPFYYSNCNGNGNNFDSREECEDSCPLQIAKDVCFLPSDVGDCYNYTQRFYYDTLEGRCKLFYYGGCGGNGNNFASESQCQRRCDRGPPEQPEPEPQPQPQPQSQFTTSMCYLEPQRGRCSENQPKWHYDYNDGSCKQFEYSGCEGNGNRFDSEEECQQSCSTLQDPCSLPKVAGQCDRWALYWYFDREEGSCRQFHYGGCSGNRNRFGSEIECRQTCVKQVAPPVQPAPEPEAQPQPRPQSYINICYLEQDPGPCTEKIEAWSYDRGSGGCVSFSYGGCNGNANRFSSEEQCERQCGEFRGQDACSPSFEVGTCDQSIEKFYFDRITGTCFSFGYTGCGGNPNRFSSIQECQDICDRHIEPPLPKGRDTEESNRAICNQPVESGACDDHINRWFYDDKLRSCSSFIYSGCAGNLNNFDSAEDCIDFCSVAGSDPNEINVGQKPEKIDCEVIESTCVTLSCSYGIERWVDDNGCSACRCHDPCASSPPPCNSPSACEVVLVQNTETGLSEYRAQCKDDNVPPQPKSGTCPELSPDFRKCESDCQYDSDCQREEKCCFNGCGYSCIMPQTGENTSGRDKPQNNYNIDGSPPFISDETQEVEEAHEGNLAALHCLAQGSPVPTITWERNGEQLIPETSSKYRITDNGTLEIVGLSKDDSGIYTCHAANGIDPPAKKDFKLTVRDGTPMPVSVVNNKKDSNVVVSLGNPAVLRCYAIGYPLPTVTWWRGDRMLPMTSQDLEQRRDNTLLIRAVKISNLGYYTCQLYNGQGKAASYTLTLKVFGPVNSIDPNDVTYNQFLEPAAPPSPPVDKPQPPPYIPPPPPPRPEKVPSEPESPDGQVFPEVLSAGQQLSEGSSLKLTCRVEGDLAQYPVYTWQKDDQPLYVNERISITNNELFITKLQESDSGAYKCRVVQPSGSFESPSRTISVQKITLHPNCTDSRYFANCALIVEANYCEHKYYAKFCCKSCTESGKLPSNYLQSIERRKRSIMSSVKLLPSRMTPINAPEDTRKIILKRPQRLPG